MPTSVYFNNQNATREQMLLEDLVIESIRNHGIDIYYIPRTSQSILDDLFGDDPVKYFDSAYKIDMYLETFQDYGGQQEFFSKFGLQIEKTARVAVARRTFEKYVPRGVRNIPKEGDLIYMPTQRKLMEIRFVEKDMSFFQLGKVEPYMYALSLETFKYNGEFINTGIEEIDAVCDESALSTNYYVSNASYGSAATFTRGEVAFQGASPASNVFGIVVSFDRPAGVLRLRNIRGQFSNTTSNTITGATSGATANLASYNIMVVATEGELADNFLIESEAGSSTGTPGSGVLDFSENNPFGEP
jgi:hypothetical protein